MWNAIFIYITCVIALRLSKSFLPSTFFINFIVFQCRFSASSYFPGYQALMQDCSCLQGCLDVLRPPRTFSLNCSACRRSFSASPYFLWLSRTNARLFILLCVLHYIHKYCILAFIYSLCLSNTTICTHCLLMSSTSRLLSTPAIPLYLPNYSFNLLT